MIGQLQCPGQGFEDVVKAHFYLKKDRILQVCYGVLIHDSASLEFTHAAKLAI